MSSLADYHPALQRFYGKHPHLFHENQFNGNPAVFDQLGKFKLENKCELPMTDFDCEIIQLPEDYIDVIPKPIYVNIDYESEWKTNQKFLDGACEAIEKHKHILIEGIAGYGKSKLVEYYLDKHSDKKHLVLNFCGSLICDVWGEYNAKTVDSCLGSKFNPLTNTMETMSSGMNFATIDILVLDECYMVNIQNLYKIQQKIKNENPELIVIYMGDPRQNELIVKHADLHVRPILESQAEIFAKLAPYRIELKVNKRAPQDQSKIETIDKMLFTEMKSPTDVLDFCIKKKWINTVSSFHEICELGIDTHVCYWSKKPVKLGEQLHDYYDQPCNKHQVFNGKHFLKRNFFDRPIGSHCEIKLKVDGDSPAVLVAVFDNGTIMKTYDEIIASATDLNAELAPTMDSLVSILFEAIGVYRVRCHVKGLIVNELVRLISSKKNAHLFVPVRDPDAKPIKLESINFNNFRFPYARSVHSTQGVTFRKRYAIHDCYTKFASAHWLFTALTRGIRLSDVYINIEDKKAEQATPHFDSFVKSKLKYYQESDKEKGWLNETYSLNKMIAMAKIAYGKPCCGVLGVTCDNMMSLDYDSCDSMSYDRLQNKIGHRFTNLRIICKACNVRSKQHDENY
jgi:hypothetical protein